MYGLFFLTFHVCVCPSAPEAVNAFILSHDYGSVFTLPSLIYLEFILVEVFLISPQIINQLSQHLILNLHPIPPIPHFLVSILTTFVRTTVTLHPHYFYRLPAGLPPGELLCTLRHGDGTACLFKSFQWLSTALRMEFKLFHMLASTVAIWFII